jgi:Mg-chelatase subunit ChlD
MPNELSTALQGLIAKASKELPRETGETAKASARYGRSVPGRVVLVCDTSGSMDDSAGSRKKIDHLREAVADVWPELTDRVLIRFDSHATAIGDPSGLTAPSGGTALHLALDEAASHCPSRTIVISDGQPDSDALAIEAAERLCGRIDVIYCGPDSDTTAIDFMRRLARAGGGSVICTDVVKHATGRGVRIGCRRLLGLPAPQ